MGKLAAISKAIDSGASKVRVAERDWVLAAKRKSQMQGLDEYFSRNDPTAGPSKPKPAPKPAVVDDDPNNGYEATTSYAEHKKLLKLASGGPVRYSTGGSLKKVGTSLLEKGATNYLTTGSLTGAATSAGTGAGMLSSIGSGLSGLGSSIYGGLAAMGPVGWAAAAAAALGAVTAKNAPKSSPLNKYDSKTDTWTKGENFAKQQYDPALLNSYYGPALAAFKKTGDVRQALAALPAPTNPQEQALFDGRDHLFSGTGNPFRQEAKEMGLKNGEWKAGGTGKKDLLNELKASANAPGPTGLAPAPSIQMPNLAAIQQQATATNAANPSQLAMLQQSRSAPPRVQPSIPQQGSPGLLQRIQAQQALRQPAPLG